MIGSNGARASTLTSRPSGQPTPRSANAKPRAKAVAAAKPNSTPAAAPDEIAERAARLGVTPERVLREYARIAFADLARLADWGPEGVVLKTPDRLDDADTAAISEIAGAPGSKNHRVKLYDKKAALDVLARHLGIFDAAPRPLEPPAPDDPEEDPREVLKRRLARLAAASAEGPADQRVEPDPGAEIAR